MSGYSPLLPLQTDPVDGVALTKTYQQVSKQNLKMLILTIPGEKVMDPEFGVGLKTFLFKNAGPSLSTSLKTKINEQVSKYLPYIQINNIQIGDASTSPENIDNNILSIGISFFIKPLDLEDILEIEVSPSGVSSDILSNITSYT